MRLTIILIAAFALTACSPAGPPRDHPECVEPTDPPIKDGGIGGTGNTPDCGEG